MAYRSIGRLSRMLKVSGLAALSALLFPAGAIAADVHQPAFGSARLDPGQTYRNVIVYRFSTGTR